MARIDGKLLKNNLKKGWTISDFAKHCGISEEAFQEYLKKNFVEMYLKPVWRDLRKNEKARQKAEKEAMNKQFSVSTIHENSQVLTEDQKIKAQLEKLKKQEADIRNDLCGKKKEYEGLQSFRMEIYKKFHEQRNFLNEIYNQIKAREENVAQLMKELKIVDEAMAKNQSSKSRREQELMGILEAIKSLEKATINCYSDGRVECEEIEDWDWSQKFESLTSDMSQHSDELFIQIHQLAEDLPVKEVKQLAKLLALLEFLKKQNKRYQIIFEKETQVSALLELVDIEIKIETL